MSTIVHYECRNPDHLRGKSRRGNGGLVIHHGSVGYCDGFHVDNAHRWVATGGVPIEYLYGSASEVGPGTYRAEDGALVHLRATTGGALRVDVDGGRRTRGDVRVAVKLSDDPDWPDAAPVAVSLIPAD